MVHLSFGKTVQAEENMLEELLDSRLEGAMGEVNDLMEEENEVEVLEVFKITTSQSKQDLKTAIKQKQVPTLLTQPTIPKMTTFVDKVDEKIQKCKEKLEKNLTDDKHRESKMKENKVSYLKSTNKFDKII